MSVSDAVRRVRPPRGRGRGRPRGGRCRGRDRPGGDPEVRPRGRRQKGVPTARLVATKNTASGPPDADQGATMAYAGQVIENPLSGERITFRQTAADTDGELLAIDLDLNPDGHVPGMHVHPIQEERFEVTKGTMRFRKGMKTVMAGPGDVVVVPPGAAHKFANAGDEPAVVRVEVRPALRMEELF